MKNSVKKEVKELMTKYNFNCSIEEFRSRVEWWEPKPSQKLSEDFIREFQNEINWFFKDYAMEIKALEKKFSIFEF